MHHFLLQHLQQLRTQLFQTELQLHQAGPGTSGWEDTVQGMQQVLKACADCTAFAENRLYPLADRYEPALIDALKQQQRTIMVQHLALGFQTFPGDATSKHLTVDAEKIRDAFDAIVLAHMKYLVQLQKGLLPVLDRYYTPEELQQVALPEQLQQGVDNKLQKSETAFRSQLYRAENELGKAAASFYNHQQALAMHY